MPQPWEVDYDLFFNPGVHQVLLRMLQRCDAGPHQEVYQQAVAALGRELAYTTDWRLHLKRAPGSTTLQTAWETLEHLVQSHRPPDAGPWWFILDYAEGREVNPEVRCFCENTNGFGSQVQAFGQGA